MNLFIREFPDELHKRLKIEAASKGKPLFRLIIEKLEKFAETPKKNENE